MSKVKPDSKVKIASPWVIPVGAKALHYTGKVYTVTKQAYVGDSVPVYFCMSDDGTCAWITESALKEIEQ